MSDSGGYLFLEIAVPQKSGSSETGGKWDDEGIQCLESRHHRVCACVFQTVVKTAHKRQPGTLCPVLLKGPGYIQE